MTREERDAHWRDVLDQFEQSGLSVSEFCRKNGVSRTQFYERHRESLVARAGAGQFMVLESAGESAVHSGARELVVELPYGVVLRFGGLAL